MTTRMVSDIRDKLGCDMSQCLRRRTMPEIGVWSVSYFELAESR